VGESSISSEVKSRMIMCEYKELPTAGGTNVFLACESGDCLSLSCLPERPGRKPLRRVNTLRIGVIGYGTRVENVGLRIAWTEMVRLSTYLFPR
jgi:hypothetical protein